MSKQTIFVRHKDEIFKKLIEALQSNVHNEEWTINTSYRQGYTDALKWTLHLITDESESIKRRTTFPEPMPDTEEKGDWVVKDE